MAKRWRSLDCGPCSVSVARAPGWLGRTNMSPVCFGAPSVNSLLTQGTHRHAFRLCQASTLESLPQALTSLPLPGAPTTPAGLTCAPDSCFPHKPGRPTPSRAGEGSTRPSCNPVSRVITTVPASQQAGPVRLLRCPLQGHEAILCAHTTTDAASTGTLHPWPLVPHLGDDHRAAALSPVSGSPQGPGLSLSLP